MKIAMIEVAACRMCPHSVSLGKNEYGLQTIWVCKMMSKPIGDSNIYDIPDWCPLPEKEE